MKTMLAVAMALVFCVVAMLASCSPAIFFMMATASAAAPKTQEENAQLSRCRELYNYLLHYETERPNHRDKGERMRAEAALDLCNAGNTRDGIDMITYELKRVRLPVPKNG